MAAGIAPAEFHSLIGTEIGDMEIPFWQGRWQRGEIGFHLPRPHPKLVSLWPALQPDATATVFVPLCGKSLDLVWLLARGHRVIGVEASELAVQQFFAEQGIDPWQSALDSFTVYKHQQLTLLCGDFFALTPAHLAGCQSVYDRAALIALPPDLRARYAATMQVLLPQATTLLLTLVYAQSEMAGPPFSVAPAELAQLYSGAERERLVDQDILVHEPRFAAKGVTALREQAWRVRW